MIEKNATGKNNLPWE